MNGTLITETADMIMFKDENGVQLSLKKRLLDLEKMNQVNLRHHETGGITPQKQDTTQSEQIKGETQPKTGKTYTSEDVERLREKYGDLGSGKTSDPKQVVTMSPAAYYKALQDATERGGEVMKTIASVAHEIETIWKVSSQTGKDPRKWVEDFMARTASKRIASHISSELSELKTIAEKLSEPPKPYEGANDKLNQLVNKLVEYDDLLKEYMIADVGDQGREKFASLEKSVFTIAEELKALSPPESK
jgi:hypothetical protein